jgi:hypothetical protein
MAVLAVGCSAAVDPAAIADAQTAARVKTALVNDPDLGARPIEVRVVRGIAELSGRVRTAAEADRAADLARAVPGVLDVRSDLEIGLESAAPRETAPADVPGFEVDDPELQGNPSLLAVGAAVGVSAPHARALLSRVAISPLIKFGAGRGFGPAVALGWFQSELRSMNERPDTLTRVHIKPLMGGVGYTFAGDRVSLSLSVVGGVAFNSLTVTDTGVAAGLPVEVDNSLAWRPGMSLWFDTSGRTAVNISVGHVMTRLRITVLEAGRLEKRETSGDTTIVHAGLAYRLF